MQAPTAYPVQYEVDYPEGPRNRLTVALRLFVAIPIAVVLSAVSGGTLGAANGNATFAAAGGALVLGPLLMIVARQKYPFWWYVWNLALT